MIWFELYMFIAACWWLYFLGEISRETYEAHDDMIDDVKISLLVSLLWLVVVVHEVYTLIGKSLKRKGNSNE